VSSHPHVDMLNEPQRRHFEVLLAMLQDTLRAIENLADPTSGPPGSLTTYDNDLPPHLAESVRPALDTLSGVVDTLARKLGLAPRRFSRVRAIRAMVLSEIVRIEDSYADKLRAYGAVDPRVRDTIEPALDALREALESITALLKPPPASAPRGARHHHTSRSGDNTA
jgi:hypothetical protein